MKLSKIIFGSFLAVALMLGFLTFTYGFAENYGLNETMNYTGTGLSDFTMIEGDLGEHGQDIQNSTSGVLEGGGTSSALVAGLWIIPEVLGILQLVPNVLASTNNIITFLLVDMIGIPAWVPAMIITMIGIAVVLIILAILLKSTNVV